MENAETKKLHEQEQELRRFLDKEKELAEWLDAKTNQSHSKYNFVLTRYTDLVNKIAHLKSEIDKTNKNKQEDLFGMDKFDPGTFVMPFGKHKDKTLREINKEDGGYLKWARDNLRQIAITDMIEAFLEEN